MIKRLYRTVHNFGYVRGNDKLQLLGMKRSLDHTYVISPSLLAMIKIMFVRTLFLKIHDQTKNIRFQKRIQIKYFR